MPRSRRPGWCRRRPIPDGGEPLNHTRYLFLDSRSREFYIVWERSARQVVSALRLLAGSDPSDPALITLVGELATHSTKFRIWWAGHTVEVHSSGTKAIRHPVVGELTLAYETLTLASAPSIRIVTYLVDTGTPSADALNLSRRARRVVVANLVIAATVVTVLVICDLVGHLPLPLGVAGHEGSTMIVGLNGLRLLHSAARRRARAAAE